MTTQADDIILDEDDVNPAAPAEVLPELEEGDDGLQAFEAPPPPPWICNADGTRTLPLKIPVSFKFKSRTDQSIKEKTIRELHFRRLSGGDLMAIDGLKDNPTAQSYDVFRRFTGEGNAVFDRLDQDDVMNVQDLIDDFFPKPRKAGKVI